MSTPSAISLSPRSSGIWLSGLLLLLCLHLTFLGSSEEMLPSPGDFYAFRLCTATSTSSFSIGRRSLSASCVGVWLLWSRLVSMDGVCSCIGHFSTQWFRTAVHSVRMFPLLSSMTADLSCWVLVRALRVFRPLYCFLTSFPSLCSCTSPQRTLPLPPSSSS